jgi:hypothetical protein
MGRINMTLDEVSCGRLKRYAKRLGRSQATVAGDLVREGLERRAAEERRRSLATDYAADRADAQEVLVVMEPGQLEILGDEDA